MNMHRSFCLFLCAISLIIISACVKKPAEVKSLKFDLFYQNQLLECNLLRALPFELNELRFYLHDLRVDNKSLQLSQNDTQHKSLAYIDFSSTLRHCDSKVYLQPNENVLFHSALTKFGSLSFEIGVPLSLNHQNPVKAQSPLNRSDMHWQWLSGYKFLRLEYLKNNQLNRLHLGSTACEGEIPDNVTCKNPNHLQINLSDFDINTSVIQVHIDELVKSESDSLCMGNFEQENCRLWLNALQNSVFKVAEQ